MGEIDYRANDLTLKAPIRSIRHKPDKAQCREMRKVHPCCLGRERFVEAWKPGDIILVSRQKVRYRAQELLFRRQKDSRKQSIQVDNPGSGPAPRKQLVVNSIVDVCIKDVFASAIRTAADWRLGYALTVHSSQGITTCDTQTVWIIDDYVQWHNLA